MSHGAARRLGLKSGPKILCSPLLESVPGLIHGFTTRVAGHSQVYGEDQLNLSFTATDKREAVERNRTDFLIALGAEEFPLLTLRQVHSDIIHLFASPEQ